MLLAQHFSNYGIVQRIFFLIMHLVKLIPMTSCMSWVRIVIAFIFLQNDLQFDFPGDRLIGHSELLVQGLLVGNNDLFYCSIIGLEEVLIAGYRIGR